MVKALHLGPDAVIRKREKKTVAVIGAGMAGMSAALGMLCKGHTVRLYESKSAPLNRQDDAGHRMLHPTINFWPDQEGYLETSTNLPFLEWYQGECKAIVEMLREEWRGYVKNYAPRLRFLNNRLVTNVTAGSNRKYKLWIDDGADDEGMYDIVIATAGFKEEVAPPAFPTPNYWHPDMLNRKIEESGSSCFTVSGAGDGGLIDALRSLLKFDDGKLAFRFTELLQGTSVHDHLKSAERRFKDSLKTGELSDADRQKIRIEYDAAASAFFNASSCDLDADFRACGSDTMDCAPKGKTCRLAYAHSLFVESRIPRRSLYLVDNEINNIAFSKAAPIHKFLISLIERDGTVQFEKGNLVEVDGKFQIHPDVGAAIDIPKKSLIYARHGASTNFKQVLNIDDKVVFNKG
ncbi:MAG: hypothetical protein V7727_21385, partial [Sneathiella sp.]